MDSYDPEKGAAADIIKGSGNDYDSSPNRKASVVESIVAADLLDERYATTKRGLKSRHAQMIALGGTIGTGLFVGSGQTLARGGPAFILVSYIIMTILVYCVVTAITEVATYLPVHGSSMSVSLPPKSLLSPLVAAALVDVDIMLSALGLVQSTLFFT